MKNSFVLNNNVEIPSIGFGTWTISDEATCKKSVQDALDAGYRHIDTAAAYQNEQFIGDVLAQSSIHRDELFITTKLWNDVRGYDETIEAFHLSLQRLKLDYVDLFLIHWPNPIHFRDNWETMNSETWRAIEDLYKQGKVKAIGVSNFRPHHLESLFKTCTIKPMVNQIELHPGLLQEDIVSFCKTHDIFIESYSPLGRALLIEKPELIELAATYNRSVAQLILRWQLQKGYLPLPRSTNTERIKQNLQVFDFEITKKDMNAIDALIYEDTCLVENPDLADF